MKLLKALMFIVCVGLIIYGQKTIGRPYLSMQLLGLTGLMGLLWDYNRKYV